MGHDGMKFLWGQPGDRIEVLWGRVDMGIISVALQVSKKT